MQYQIITDANADMTEGMQQGLPAIEVIPMDIDLSGEARTCGTGGNITTREFYAALRGGKFATTSMINPEVYRSAFEPVLKSGRDVLYLSLSSALSSTIEIARMCAAELEAAYPGRLVVVVDSLAASAGQGVLACEAARRQKEGATLSELAAWITKHRLEVCHWFTVDTFEHLRRGGRVSAATAAMGTLLQIKPLLHVDNEGALKAVERPRGRKKAIEAQLARMAKGWNPNFSKRVVVGHGDAIEDANKLAAAISALYPDAEIEMVEINPIIGAHTGPGILALVFWGSER